MLLVLCWLLDGADVWKELKVKDCLLLVCCCLQLSSLPPEIGQLRNLRVLFAYRNKLVEVPEELGACTQLEVPVQLRLIHM